MLVQEQCGRATNGLAWAMHTAPQWWADVATDYQRGRWLLPAVRDEKHEAYAITEEFAGSDVSGLQSTARRDGDEYVIDGVKWHVTSYNLADYLFVQARLVGGEYHGEHVLLVVDLPWPGVEIVARHTIRITLPTSTRSLRSTAYGFRCRTLSAPRARA
ncbi:MAG: acyl-CoA dehydrogenase [Mycobacterium sp.]|nr:acyl-CoA dehydrogenase [Mycobacterium sp.]